MLPKNFKIEHEHIDFDSFTMDSAKHGFNTIVIATTCSNSNKPISRIGRLVQVRKDSGCFGTDTILIRMTDGNLQSWENVTFCTVAEKFKPLYESFFKDVELDEPDIEYSICNKLQATGFIVTGMDCTEGKTHSFDMCISKDKVQFSEVRTNG